MIKNKSFTILFGFVLVTIKAFAQDSIPNYSFEKWHMVNGAYQPVSWTSLNGSSVAGTVITCDTAYPGLPGDYYLSLTSSTNTTTGVVIPGIAVCGTLNTAKIKLDTIHVTNDSILVMIDSASLVAASGFPFTQRPKSLNGYMQYMTFETSGNESGYVNIHLTHWDTTTKTRVSIATANYPLYGMNMTWSRFTIPLTYNTTTENPDTCTIMLSASGYPPTSGDYLWIDNLNFNGVNTGIPEETTHKSFNIFPNPATTGEINITNNGGGEAQLSIYTIVGQPVKSETLTQNQQTISIDGLANGCYIVSIKSNGSVVNERLIIQRN